MKFRPHTELLADSMKQVIELEPTKEVLRKHIESHNCFVGSEKELKVESYGFDDRIDWKNHIVTIGGFPVGWTDGPLKD